MEMELMATERRKVVVVGAGVLGLWQALLIARAGHSVRLFERSAAPFADAASRFAGAMIAPDCEGEAAPEIVQQLGHHGMELWQALGPELTVAGTLVVAQPRDQADLTRFSRTTHGFETVDETGVAALEPDLAGRFPRGLFFPREAHMPTPAVLDFLLDACRAAGVVVAFGEAWDGDVGAARRAGEVVVDCRGMAARSDLPGLRGVRGERLVVASREVRLSRPVRLLHPRHPIYVVPWGDGRFVVGATVIESEDAGPATVRSALELMGAAYALHPAFGEAEIVEIGAGVRPAFADNVPRVVVEEDGALYRVNGAYRHGFLLGPVLAEALAVRLGDRSYSHPLIVAAK
jgi:glycine oxidase